MSAFGYKQTSSGQLANVRFTPESGHSEAQERLGLKKRTSDVRFAPNSGRKWLCRGMSAYDPKQTKFGAVERMGDRLLDSMSRLRDHGIPRSTGKERERT